VNGERIRRRQFSLICSGVTAVGARGVVDDVASTIALIWWMTRRAPVDYVVEGVASTAYQTMWWMAWAGAAGQHSPALAVVTDA